MVTLYIKTHNKTGLKYFGKTTQDPFKYKGSGIYWKRHIEKYGYDVNTEILGTFVNKSEELVEKALKFSKDNNIVKSKQWANLKPENGLDGGKEKTRKIQIKETYSFFKKVDIDARRLMGLTGIIMPKEQRLNISKALKNIPKEEKAISDKKRSESNKGRIKSKEEIKKISVAKKGIKQSIEHKKNNKLANKGRVTAFDIYSNEIITTNEKDFLSNKHYIGLKAKKFYICDNIIMRGKDLELYAKSKGFSGTNFSYKSEKFKYKFISSIEEINKEKYIEYLTNI